MSATDRQWTMHAVQVRRPMCRCMTTYFYRGKTAMTITQQGDAAECEGLSQGKSRPGHGP